MVTNLFMMGILHGPTKTRCFLCFNLGTNRVVDLVMQLLLALVEEGADQAVGIS